MSDKVFGVGIIGCGSIAQVHLQNLATMPNIQIRALCDVLPERAQAAAKVYGGAVYSDYHELLARSDIDVVHLCTPHDCHAPMALDALRAGKVVLTEKPMASEVAHAQQMIREADGRLGVIFQNRWNKASIMAKNIVESGEMGELCALRGMVCWHRTPQYYQAPWRGSWQHEGGGTLINQAIHTLDLMLWLGGDPESVRGAVSTDLLQDCIEVEDSAHFTVRMTNGRHGVFYATNANHIDAPVELELYFERGSLLIRGSSLWRRDETGEQLLFEPEVTATGAKAYWGLGHLPQFQDFYAALAQGEPLPVPGESAIKALLVLKSVYRASEERRTVKISEWEDAQ